MISSKILLRYMLLQLPALIILIIVLFFIRRMINIPVWIAVIIVLVWLIKDIIMFPRVWRSYDTKIPGHRERLIGMKGIVMDGLNPTGYVKIMGELWKAERIETERPIERGDYVRVVKMEGLKLFVALEGSESGD